MIFNYFTTFYGILIIAPIWNKAGTTKNLKKHFKCAFSTGLWLKPVLKGVAVQCPAKEPLAPVPGTNRC
jgi:hypothetical protein